MLSSNVAGWRGAHPSCGPDAQLQIDQPAAATRQHDASTRTPPAASPTAVLRSGHHEDVRWSLSTRIGTKSPLPPGFGDAHGLAATSRR